MTTKTAFQYSHTIGFLSNRYKGFQHPVDMAIDSQGLLYVLNRVGPEVSVRIPYKRITICTVDEEYLGEISTGGMGDGQMWWPSSLAFDSEDKLYVADEALNRVSIFSKEGDYLGQWGVQGSGPGQLDRPSGIAFDPEDNLMVTDSLNHRVQKFHRDGTFINTWGELGTGPGQFNMPWGITVVQAGDQAGDVYVADWRNDRIQKLDATGKLIAQWGSSGEGEGQFNRPAGIAVDEDGNMYVADCMLLQVCGRNVLVDTGVGTKEAENDKENLGLVPSRLLKGLKSFGLTPKDIHAVILTHLHFDHSGGCTRLDRAGNVMPTFPKARYYIQRSCWDEACNPNERCHATHRSDNFKPIDDRGQLEILDGDAEIFPGLNVIVTDGHAKGHQSVMFNHGGERVVFLGDLVPTPHHLNLTVISAFDSSPEDTLTQKRDMLSQAEREGWLLVFSHGHDTRAGYLERRGDMGYLKPVEL